MPDINYAFVCRRYLLDSITNLGSAIDFIEKITVEVPLAAPDAELEFLEEIVHAIVVQRDNDERIPYQGRLSGKGPNGKPFFQEKISELELDQHERIRVLNRMVGLSLKAGSGKYLFEYHVRPANADGKWKKISTYAIGVSVRIDGVEV